MAVIAVVALFEAASALPRLFVGKLFVLHAPLRMDDDDDGDVPAEPGVKDGACIVAVTLQAVAGDGDTVR